MAYLGLYTSCLCFGFRMTKFVLKVRLEQRSWVTTLFTLSAHPKLWFDLRVWKPKGLAFWWSSLTMQLKLAFMRCFLPTDRGDLGRNEDKVQGSWESDKIDISLKPIEKGTEVYFLLVLFLHLIKFFLNRKRPCSHRIIQVGRVNLDRIPAERWSSCSRLLLQNIPRPSLCILFLY